jgi:hypothetical protein
MTLGEWTSSSSTLRVATLFRVERFLLQPCGTDELIAPQASFARVHRSDDAEDVENFPVAAKLDLRANLHSGNDVLMHDRIED